MAGRFALVWERGGVEELMGLRSRPKVWALTPRSSRHSGCRSPRTTGWETRMVSLNFGPVPVNEGDVGWVTRLNNGPPGVLRAGQLV